MAKRKKVRKQTEKRMDRWAEQPLPSIDETEVERVGQEMQGWLDVYEAGDASCLGPVLNRLWCLNAALNPAKLQHGHNHRDDALSAYGAAKLFWWRHKADELIDRFGLGEVIAGDEVRSVIQAASRHLDDQDQGVHADPEILPHLHLDSLPPDEGRATARRRNILFALWKKSEQLTIREIEDRWNSLSEADRKTVSPRLSSPVDTERAKKAIKSGREQLKVR